LESLNYFLFDGFVQPHMSIWVLLCIYSRSLFSMDNLSLRPKSQDNSRTLKFNFLRFVLMWLALCTSCIDWSTNKSISKSLSTHHQLRISQMYILLPHLKTWIILIRLTVFELWVFIILAFFFDVPGIYTCIFAINSYSH
jgi:hypothetical protein